MEISFEKSRESLLELLVCEGVTEGVDGTVGVTEEVDEHVDVAVGTEAEGLHDGDDVVGRPAGHEGSHDHRDGLQRFIGSILGLRLLLLRFLLFLLEF